MILKKFTKMLIKRSKRMLTMPINRLKITKFIKNIEINQTFYLFRTILSIFDQFLIKLTVYETSGLKLDSF